MRSLPLLPMLDIPDVDWSEVRANLSLRSIRILSQRRVREQLGKEHQAVLEKALTLVRSPIPSDISKILFSLIPRARGAGFNTCFENAKINVALGKDICRQVLLYRFKKGSDMTPYQMTRNDFVYVITNNLFPMAEAMVEKWPSLITDYDTFEIVSPLDSHDRLWNPRSQFLMRMMQRHCFRLNLGSRQVAFPLCGLLGEPCNEDDYLDHPNNPTTLERICRDDFVRFYECVEETFPHFLHYKEVVLIMMKHAALTFRDDGHLGILEKLADICPSALISSDGSQSALQVYCKWFFYDEWYHFQPSIQVLTFFLLKAEENHMIADEECMGLLSPDETDMNMTAMQWIIHRLLRIDSECHNQCLDIIVQKTSLSQIIKRCISDAEEASEGYWDGGDRPQLSYILSITDWEALLKKHPMRLATLSAEEIVIIIFRLNVHARNNSDEMEAVYTILFQADTAANSPFDTLQDSRGRLVLHIILEDMKDFGYKLSSIILNLLIADHRRALTRANPVSGLLPFMEAASIVYRDGDNTPFLSSVSVVYELIRNDPSTVENASSVLNIQDLHMN